MDEFKYWTCTDTVFAKYFDNSNICNLIPKIYNDTETGRQFTQRIIDGNQPIFPPLQSLTTDQQKLLNGVKRKMVMGKN
jgi:hypothetical protein